MNIINSVKRKIGKSLYKICRNQYLKTVIPNIGVIKEDENKITCYVTKHLIEKNGKKISYELHCPGMNNVNEEIKKTVDTYKLDKPVYYIFDGIKFDTTVRLSNPFSNVIFKNCSFNEGLNIIWGNKVTLENNKYYNVMSDYLYRDSFLTGNVGELIIKDDNFINSYELKKYTNTKFGIVIKCDKLKVINSNIYAENDGQINIKAKMMEIINSTIEGAEIYIDSDSIKSDFSLLKSDNGIIIENKNCDCNIQINFSNTHTPYVIYNQIEMVNNNKLKVNYDRASLQEKRQALLKVLKIIKNNCDKINNNKIEKLKNNLEQQSLEKVLKR